MHSLNYENVTRPTNNITEKAAFISVGTDKVVECLSPCSSHTDMQKYFRQSPPQYSDVLAEHGYTYMNDDSTTPNNSSVPVRMPKLTCSLSLSNDYITNKDRVFFDKHESNKELPEEVAAQGYDGEFEAMTDPSILGGNTFGQEYMEVDFLVSGPRFLLESKCSLSDFDENRHESSPLHNLSSSLVIDEACNSFQGSCSRIDTSFYTEDSGQTTGYEKSKSPQFSTSDSECGYIEFQSIIGQDISLSLNS